MEASPKITDSSRRASLAGQLTAKLSSMLACQLSFTSTLHEDITLESNLIQIPGTVFGFSK